jgi:hypothetical protein
MRWAGHVARRGEVRGVRRVLVGSLRERGHWGDKDVDGMIILRWIFRKLEVVVGTGWSWLRFKDRWRARVGTVRDFRVP